MVNHPNTSEKRDLPVKLERDLILDSVVEIRFVPAVPKDEVNARVFDAIYRDFPLSKDVTVPPVEMRAMEPFKYMVTTVLHNNNFSIGFGNSSIVFNCVNGYKGWGDYFKVIQRYLQTFFSIGLFAEIVRIGIRYVNFFVNSTDLSKNIQLNINFNNISEYTSLHTGLKLQLEKGECQFMLNIADTALANGVPGSLLDIDVSKAAQGAPTFENICRDIQHMHQEEKKIFINILHPEFLKTLGPSY